MDQSRAPAYRLVRRPLAGAGPGPADGPHGPHGADGPPGAPRLDQAQQQVVDHAGGPLLVLAGPGTGKTTTIVAAVADRIENRGIAPERILVLTFSRKAAAELRERITARLKRTTREPLAVTFHSYAYALVRDHALKPTDIKAIRVGSDDLRRLYDERPKDGVTVR